MTMALDDTQDRRRRLLQALVDHPDIGTKADLGRALGYKNGAFVGQMLRGDRPITEKTTGQVHAMRGGRFKGWFDAAQVPSTSTPRKRGVALDLSQSVSMITPTIIDWGEAMETVLQEFSLRIEDDAMAPEVRAGQVAMFIRGDDARANDFVLLVDNEDNVYLREYSPRRPGHWLAVARDPAYQPLDSKTDGLRVLAIYNGVVGRRG